MIKRYARFYAVKEYANFYLLIGGTLNIEYFTYIVNRNRKILRKLERRIKVIYQRVKAACKDNSISVSELEERLKFPKGSMYKWDENIPSVVKISAVAKALGKPMEYFLEDEEV